MILRRISRFEAGVPDNHKLKNEIKKSFLPVPGGMNMNVKYKAEGNVIREIEIKDNDTLREWTNTRY